MEKCISLYSGLILIGKHSVIVDSNHECFPSQLRFSFRPHDSKAFLKDRVIYPLNLNVRNLQVKTHYFVLYQLNMHPILITLLDIGIELTSKIISRTTSCHFSYAVYIYQMPQGYESSLNSPLKIGRRVKRRKKNTHPASHTLHRFLSNYTRKTCAASASSRAPLWPSTRLARVGDSGAKYVL